MNEDGTPQKVAALTSGADWDRVEQVFLQCADAVTDVEPFLPAVLPAFLAELVARVSVAYFRDEYSMVLDALSVMPGPDRCNSASAFLASYKDSRFLSLRE